MCKLYFQFSVVKQWLKHTLQHFALTSKISFTAQQYVQIRAVKGNKQDRKPDIRSITHSFV